MGALLALASSGLADPARNFRSTVEPLLAKYCLDCHGGGIRKGGVSLDELGSDAELVRRHDVWFAVLKNVRAGLMPPREEGAARPSAAEIETLSRWIKYEAFGIDPADPDPGRVAPRRLNRVEYRNTIRDLTGFDFNSEVEFPPDDTGNGFDNNGEVLTVSPLLLEKYLAAAETIVEKAVPKVARVVRERVFSGRDFRAQNGPGSGDQLNARRAVTVSRSFEVDQADRYQIIMDLETRGTFDFDGSRCRLIARIDGEEKFSELVVWSERRPLRREFEVEWRPGRHVVSFEVAPLSPADEGSAAAGRPQSVQGQTSVTMRVGSVTVRGPLSPEHWIAPENHARFFPGPAVGADPAERDRRAGELLGAFAKRAFRRPLEPAAVDRLVGISRQVYSGEGRTFEEGVGRAMMAVLASPRFLFRVETSESGAPAGPHAPLDEWSLASRLSYFL
ncbi:MAG: DUF1587 domain-containing protein, partial [Opitutaceae bacterium]